MGRTLVITPAPMYLPIFLSFNLSTTRTTCPLSVDFKFQSHNHTCPSFGSYSDRSDVPC